MLLAAGIAAAPDAQGEFFDKRVAPILQKRCLMCHNEELKNGGISFVDRETLLKAGPRGPAIVPGKPGQSVLIRAVRYDSEPMMPPGIKLRSRDIRVLTDWVRQGAIWGTKLRK